MKRSEYLLVNIKSINDGLSMSTFISPTLLSLYIFLPFEKGFTVLINSL